MNPRDIMTDAIHNFHPQYQQYTQYSSDNTRFRSADAQRNQQQQQQQSRQHAQPQQLERPLQSQHNNGVVLRPTQTDLETTYGSNNRTTLPPPDGRTGTSAVYSIDSGFEMET